jgi:hypothetical protein
MRPYKNAMPVFRSPEMVETEARSLVVDERWKCRRL